MLLVPLIWAQIAAQSARELLLDPTFAKGVISQSGLYLQLERRLVDEFVAAFVGPQSPPQFTPGEFRTLINGVLPAGQIKALAEAAIDDLYTWFDSGKARPELVVDLTAVQQALPPALQQFVEAKVAALPVCTVRQALDLARDYNGGIPPCRSGNAEFDKMMIGRAIQSIGFDQLIPAQFDLVPEVERRYGQDFWTAKSRWFSAAHLVVLATRWGWYLIAALLVVLVMLNREKWHTPFGWASAPLLIAGLTVLTAGWIGMEVLLPFADTLATPTQASSAIVYSLVKATLESIAAAMKDMGLFISLGGLACLAVWAVGNRISRADWSAPQG